MYWLRWHYNVKDIAGAPYKIKQKKLKLTNNVETAQLAPIKCLVGTKAYGFSSGYLKGTVAWCSTRQTSFYLITVIFAAINVGVRRR